MFFPKKTRTLTPLSMKMAITYILHLKIHVKISENHKKGNKYLRSLWFSQCRPDFLSVFCFVSGCGNPSVGHFLISVCQDWRKIYDVDKRSCFNSRICLGRFVLCINLTWGIFIDTPFFLLSWRDSVNVTKMFTNPFCLTYFTR